MNKILQFFLPNSNPAAKSRWCRFGLHWWSVALGRCEECGMPDWILVGKEALKKWREEQ